MALQSPLQEWLHLLEGTKHPITMKTYLECLLTYRPADKNCRDDALSHSFIASYLFLKDTAHIIDP